MAVEKYLFSGLQDELPGRRLCVQVRRADEQTPQVEAGLAGERKLGFWRHLPELTQLCFPSVVFVTLENLEKWK